MDAVFIKLLNMSITASWLVLTVILLRLLLQKTPKWIMGILWGFVAIRLICPFSLESIFSLVPSTEPIPQNIILSENPAINSGLPILNQTINPILSESLAPNVGDSVNPMQIIVSAASVVWMIGILVMLLYTLISYVRIRRKVGEAVPLKDNIWVCDHISTPFILGMIRPRIYLPSSMNEGDMEYVISHEKAHLKRKDHIWKPLGFLLLSVYWFHPIFWVAYILLCKDIELACDEKVIRQFGAKIKKPYTDALINCSVPRKMTSACPLAFGEVGVKERVKGVLNYKKPAFWVILVAVVACIITAVCLLTNPVRIKITQIKEGPDFSNLFNNIQEVTIFSGENNYTTNDEGTIGKMVRLLQDVKIKSRPISQSRAENRDMTHRITINEDNTLCFSENYSELWIDTGVKPTFSYEVLNPSKVKNVFEIGAETKVKVGGADGPNKIIVNPSGYPLEYHYSSGKDHAALSLDPQSKKFSFTFSMLSSYFAMGTYKEDDEYITAYTDDNKYMYTFKKDDQSLAFVAVKSSQMPSFAYSAGAKAEVCVPDGAVFQPADSKNVQPGTNPYFNAEVLEVNEKSILVKPDSDSNEIKSADKISVSLEVTSTIPIPTIKVGDRVRVIYNGEIAETYPAQINKAFVIYLLSDDGKVLSPTPAN